MLVWLRENLESGSVPEQDDTGNENTAVGEKDLHGFIWLLCWKMLHPPLKGQVHLCAQVLAEITPCL